MVGGGVDEAGLGVGGMQYEQAQREIWPVRVRLGWRGGDGGADMLPQITDTASIW